MRLDQDVVVGALGLALAGIYYYFSTDIQQSLLSDAVGAHGLPQIYAATLALLGLVLIARATMRGGGQAHAITHVSKDAGVAHARAIGLLGFGVAYLALIAPLGYLVTVFLLLLGTARYVGAHVQPRLIAISAAGAALLWLVFVKLFALSLPAGEIWPLLH